MSSGGANPSPATPLPPSIAFDYVGPLNSRLHTRNVTRTPEHWTLNTVSHILTQPLIVHYEGLVSVVECRWTRNASIQNLRLESRDQGPAWV